MKRFLLAISLFLSIFFASCSNDVKEVVDTKLSLSEEGVVTVPNTFTETEVTISTDGGSDWKYYAASTWISLTKVGDNLLKVAVSPNTAISSRQTDVMVFSGNAVAKFTINQDAGDIKLSTNKDKIDVDNWGGSCNIYVSSNSEEWTATANVEWVKLVPDYINGELIVEIFENDETTSRTAEIVIINKKSNSSSKVIINQGAALFYILPYLKPSAKQSEIAQFESNRRSKPFFDDDFVKGSPSYDTKSKAFVQMQYEFGSQTENGPVYFVQARAIVDNPLVLDENFINVLKENGFSATDEQDKYVKEDSDNKGLVHVITATIIRDAKDGNGVFYDIVPKQKGSFPTYDTLPKGYLYFRGNEIDKKIIAFETEKGGVSSGTWAGSGSWALSFSFQGNKDSLIIRRYDCYNNYHHYDRVEQYITDISKFYYYVKGDYYLTDEFKALMKKEGYVEDTKYYFGYTFFLHDNHTIAVRRARYKEINNANPIVEVTFMKR